MKPPRPQKKKPEEIKQKPLRELELSPEDWEEFERGVNLFNSGKFWHAHEAWELVWQRHSEDERLFFQGLIQLAAAYHHLITKQSYRGLMNNFDKAYSKLEVFQPEYVGVFVMPLLRFIEQGKKEAERLGIDGLEQFNYNLIPKLQFHKPNNPDLLVEIRDIVNSQQFLEGMKLFNEGYHWEAHEVWEDVWREQNGDAKMFIQAFVQTAAAYSFMKTSKFSTATYLFEKALEKFHQYENLDCKIPLKYLIGELQNTLTELNSDPMNNGKAIKLAKVPVFELHAE